MKYRIEFLEIAEAELEDTIEWYESLKNEDVHLSVSGSLKLK